MIRYIQLLLVIGAALTLFLFVSGAIDALIDGRDIPTWIKDRYVVILVSPWSIVLIIVVGDMLLGWRYPIWCVDDSGIVILVTKRSKPRLVRWKDIASLRVYPLGIVTITTNIKPVNVSMLLAVDSESALWLRDFASIQLAKATT